MPNLKAADSTYIEHIEYHFHNEERWFGASADQSGDDWALESSLTAFSATSQAGDFTASAVKVLGTDDTPDATGMTLFDSRRILIASAADNLAYVFRVIWGTGTSSSAETANQYTDIMFFAVTAAGPGAAGVPLDIRMPLLAVGTKVWVKVKAATSQAVTFYAGLHEYVR